MKPKEYPFVSIIVVMRNEEEYIEECLKSLIQQDYPKEKYEIIVVDGESTDESVNIVKNYMDKYANIRLVNNSKRILASGWNIGIKLAKGDIVIRPDAHSYVSKDFIRKNVETLKCVEDAVCVGGRLYNISKGGFISKAISNVLSSPFGVGNSRFRVSEKAGYVDTIAYGAYRKNVFHKVGYFNESLRRNQDLELHSRIKEYGGKFYLNPEIKCYYYTRQDFKGLINQAFNNGLWNILTLKFQRKALSVRHLVPLIFILALLFNIILSFISYIGQYLLILQLLSYIISGSIYAVKICKKEGGKYFIISLVLFFALHVSYGLGSLFGIIKFISYNP
jgi:cellulose synthase/poly-beta-1,6-N-acetylglucosamine synthase-like glycosyltransferase